MVDKERISDGTLQLLIDKGYKGLRMDDLAAFLGISKKTLYNHFGSKDALLSYAIGQKVESILKMLDLKFEDKHKSFTARLEEVLSLAGNALSFTESFKDQGLPEDLKISVFSQIRDHVLDIIRRHIEEGIRDGYLRDDFPADTLTYLHFGIIESFLSMEERYGIKTTLKDILRFIRTIAFTGLLTEKGRDILEDQS